MEQLTEVKKTNILLQYGMMGALGSALLYVILYLGGTSFFSSLMVIPLSLAIPIIIAIFACIKAKRENGGFLSFKGALKICFGIFVLSALATTILSFFIYYFDPAFKESMMQLTIEKTQQMMAKFNAPQDTIDKAIKQISETDIGSVGTMVKNFAQGCIFWFVIALIVAAIMKKNKPEFA
jgi:hypothetical protein